MNFGSCSLFVDVGEEKLVSHRGTKTDIVGLFVVYIKNSHALCSTGFGAESHIKFNQNKLKVPPLGGPAGE